jgi:two-component system, cell cycle sensor histidine kinase and response regulator CckA
MALTDLTPRSQGGARNTLSVRGEVGSFEVTEVVSTADRAPIALVIDDLESMNELVVEALNRFGYPAVGAANAEQTQGIVNSTPSLRVLICDVYLGEVTGPALVRQILRTRPDLKVIFMSGGLNSIPFRRTDPFLKKPFDLKSLRATVETVLAQPPEPGAPFDDDGDLPLDGDRRRR